MQFDQTYVEYVPHSLTKIEFNINRKTIHFNKFMFLVLIELNLSNFLLNLVDLDCNNYGALRFNCDSLYLQECYIFHTHCKNVITSAYEGGSSCCYLTS